jgi:hypothetical protein
MPARVIPTRRPLHERAWNWMQRAWLQFCIDADEQYLRACADDGLLDSLSIRDFRRVIEARRVQLAILENEL